MAPWTDPIGWLLGLGIMTIIIIVVLFIVIGLLLNTVFLLLALKITDSKHTDFGEVFVTALIMALVSWIPCIGCILSWVIISNRHDTGIAKAIGIWLLAGLIPLLIIVGIVIAIIPLIVVFF